MIQSFKIVNYLNDSLFLDIRKPEDTGFVVYSVSGLNTPDADISTTGYANFDGSLVGNIKMPEREIEINLIFFMDNMSGEKEIDGVMTKYRETIEELRWKCYKYFPIKKQLKFYVNNDHGSFWINGIVQSIDVNIFTKQEGAKISLLCPDPYFTKDVQETRAYISQVVPTFEFRCSFEAIIPDDPMAPEIEYVCALPGPNGGSYFKYEGDYIVTPRAVDQSVDTKDTWLEQDITVLKTPYMKTENDKGGLTVKIGE